MNKKSLGVVATTAIILSQTLLSAAPSTAAAPVITNTTSTTQTLQALFRYTEGCITTSVSFTFLALPDVTVGHPSVSRFDTCLGQTLIDVEVDFGSGALADVVVKKGLSGATARMTMIAKDFANNTFVPVTVDASFEATGKASRGTSRSVILDEGRRITSTTVTETRPAVATATVTVGSEIVLDPSISSTTGEIPAFIAQSTVTDSVKDSSGL